MSPRDAQLEVAEVARGEWVWRLDGGTPRGGFKTASEAERDGTAYAEGYNLTVSVSVTRLA